MKQSIKRKPSKYISPGGKLNFFEIARDPKQKKLTDENNE